MVTSLKRSSSAMVSQPSSCKTYVMWSKLFCISKYTAGKVLHKGVVYGCVCLRSSRSNSGAIEQLPNTREFRIMCSTSLEIKCRTLFIWTNADKREEVSEAIWPLKVRFESSVTPRSLAKVIGTRSWPRKGTAMLLCNFEISFLTPNRTNWVLPGLIKSWLALHHSATCWRSSATWRRHESFIIFWRKREIYLSVINVTFDVTNLDDFG